METQYLDVQRRSSVIALARGELGMPGCGRHTRGMSTTPETPAQSIHRRLDLSIRFPNHEFVIPSVPSTMTVGAIKSYLCAHAPSFMPHLDVMTTVEGHAMDDQSSLASFANAEHFSGEKLIILVVPRLDVCVTFLLLPTKLEAYFRKREHCSARKQMRTECRRDG